MGNCIDNSEPRRPSSVERSTQPRETMAEALQSERDEDMRTTEEVLRVVPNGIGEDDDEYEEEGSPEELDVTALPHISDREGKSLYSIAEASQYNFF